MSGVFVLLFLLSALAIIIGMIRPGEVIRWGKTRTRSRVALIYGSAAIFCFAGVGICAGPIRQQEARVGPVIETPLPSVSTPQQTAPVAIPRAQKEFIPNTFEELNSFFSAASDRTELQKDEVWKGYKGKYVRWTGEVTYIDESWGGISVGFRHLPTTLTYDILAKFPKTAKAQLLQLSEGTMVTYSGRLDSRGGAILPYGISDVTIETVQGS